MITISNIPLSVYNRALELFGEPPEATIEAARDALNSAEGRMGGSNFFESTRFFDRTFSLHFARAVAECMSASGPWEEGSDSLPVGEHAGEGGYIS